MTIVLVDGYNVLHGCSPFKELCDVDLETARDRLIERLLQHGAHSGEHIILVFDGTDEFAHVPATVNSTYIEIVFTTGGMSADTYIQRKLRRGKNGPDDRIVVSADNAIKIAASSMGAIAIGPEMFLRHVEHAQTERAQGATEPKRKPHHARVEELITSEDEQRLKNVCNNDREDPNGPNE